MERGFTSSPNDNILDWSKSGAFLDYELKIFQKAEFFLDKVGKEVNAGNQQFLLFPQCFQKASVQGHRNQLLFGKVLTTYFRLFQTGSISNSMKMAECYLNV